MQQEKQPQQDQSAYLMPLTKQKGELVKIAQELAQKREIENSEVAILLIEGKFDRPLSEYSLTNESDLDSLLTLVGQMRMRLGFDKNVNPDHVKLEAEYLKAQWGSLSKKDITNAIDFLVSARLDYSMAYQHTFSTLVIGGILASYRKFRATVLGKVEKVAGDREAVMAKPISIQEQVETIKDIIRLCHEHYKNGFQETFFNRTVYDFLRKTKRMIFTDESVKRAKEFAEKEYQKWNLIQQQGTAGNLSEVLRKATSHIDKDSKIRQFGIQYCLKEYFDNNDLEKVIQSISEKDYQKK